MVGEIGQTWEMFNTIPAFLQHLFGSIHPLIAIIQRDVSMALDRKRFSNLKEICVGQDESGTEISSIQ